MEIKESLSLEEQIPYDSQKENQTNIKSKSKIKSHHKNDPNYSLINKPQKRARDYSPEMDLEDEEEEEINNTNNINKNIKKHNNKRMKLPLTKFVERLTLNDPDENPKNKVYKSDNKSTSNKKKKRGIKIFSDMSISEISNNLFKNYYQCILPEYYMDQISEQIIKNQIDKLSSNFLKEKKEEVKNKKIKINQNMDYLRELAEKQGEWVDYEQNVDEKGDNNEDEEQGYKSYDSNSENNSKNSYPEDESIIEEQEDDKDFDEKYDYYENDDYNDEY
jgi:hypothetical protein